MLITGKIRCYYCGSPIDMENQTVLNEYTLREEHSGDNYKLDIQFKVSDNAIEKVGNLLLGNGTSNAVLNFRNRAADTVLGQPPQLVGSQPESSPELKKLPEKVAEADEKFQETESRKVIDLDEVFPIDDRLELKVKDFKGKTKAEQQRRFILIYVWGYNKHFSSPVPSRKLIISASREKKLWGTSFGNLITRLKDDVLIETKDGFKLSPIGDKEVVTIVQEIKNSELVGFDYQDSRSSRKPSLKKKVEQNSQNEIGGLIEKWESQSKDLGDFDIKSLHTIKSRQKIQFGLWVLEKVLAINSARLDAVIEFLYQVFPTIGGDRQSLKNSVTNNKYIGRTAQGECFLTKEGEKDIENLLPAGLKIV